MKDKKITFSIGVDAYDNKFTYCLFKILDGKIEILLSKTMNNSSEFKQEVENLSKYLNAKIYGDADQFAAS